MRVAIVHDYIKEYGGAERVVEAMLEIWPEAEIFTAIYSPEFLGPHKSRFDKFRIHTSFLQSIPFKNKLISAARLIGPFIFKNFDLRNFDVVIVSQAGTFVSPNYIRTGRKTLLVTYCHTPPRWLYGYPTAGGWERGYKKIFKKILGSTPMKSLMKKDYEAAQLPDYYLANSQEVRSRIRKFYHRDATVIYPPVEMPEIKKVVKGDYYLTGGRLARPKRIDLAVAACTMLNIQLKVFGKEFAGYGEELKKNAGQNVKFLGEITDGEKIVLMANAKAFIFPAMEEDFGITPVESMATGTPVIAYKSGGVKESVIDEKTGIFFNEPTVESLVKAIKKFETKKILKEDCINQARKFSKNIFKKTLLEFITKHAKISSWPTR